MCEKWKKHKQNAYNGFWSLCQNRTKNGIAEQNAYDGF